MSIEIYIALGLIGLCALSAGFFFGVLRKPKSGAPLEPPPKTEARPSSLEPAEEKTPVEETPPKEAALNRPVEPANIKKSLSRTRGLFEGKLGRFLSLGANKSFAESEWEGLEEALLEADVGLETATQILEKVRARVGSDSNGHALGELIREECETLFSEPPRLQVFEASPPKPFVITVVGVNGVGKTTTIGKVAHHFKSQGKNVLLGAADTFRAGAISQLKIWAERIGVQFVTGREGADPGAVAFDSVSAGQARGMDVVILDTAGRLHTKSNLMDELKKVHRVIKKVIPDAPHEIWLVLDGTLGQNSIQQAKEFCKTLEVTGVIVTKLDGTAKGGAILAIASDLKLPVRFIGIGEKLNDLIPFEAGPFVKAIFDSTEPVASV